MKTFGASRLGLPLLGLGLILNLAACGPTDGVTPDPQPTPSATPTPVADALAPARQAFAAAQTSFNALSAQMNTVGPWTEDSEYELQLDLALAKIGSLSTRGALATGANLAPAAAHSGLWARLENSGDLNSGGDIEAIAFVVMMQAAKSAEEDLKAILEQVKEANQKKAALRAQLQAARDAAHELAQALEGAYKSISGKDAGQSDDKTATTLSRFAFVGTDTVIASGAYAAGPVSVQIDCPNIGESLVSIAIEDVSQGITLASSAFAATSVRTQFELQGPTSLRFRAKTQLSALQETYCTYQITGRAASVSGRKPWTAEQRRIAVGLAQDLTNTRNSAAQTLLASVLSQELTEAQAAVLLAKLRTDFNAGGAAQDLGSDQLVELTDTIGDPLDSLSDLSELSSLRLRSFMDRRAKALEAISNIFKKFAETQAKIVANLK